jgi:hypothetical protein
MNPKKIFVVMMTLVVSTFVIPLALAFGQVDSALLREDISPLKRDNEGGNFNDYARAIALDGSGNVYVTGYSYGSGTDYDYATIKYDPNGTEIWIKRYNGPADSTDCANAIAVDDSNNVYVTGYSYGSGTYEDYATIKYKPNGDTAWVRRYNGPGDSTDRARAITVDGSGNVYVTGRSMGTGTWYDYATIKYKPDGDTAWVRRYNGPANSVDDAYAIAVDGSGNVYVTGGSYGSYYQDYATIKYYPNGDIAWVKRYNGPGFGPDIARAIAVDGSGNVCVTGSGWGSPGITSWDYATIKYYPNGDTAWVRRYWDGNAYDITVDDSGKVYVTGENWGSKSDDYATIKYKSNGDIIWVRRYSGVANRAYAIAVDGSGNVCVTGGRGYGSGTYEDYATIKYYPNGDTAWVRTYNGPGNANDEADAIAVDGSGNVYVTGWSYGGGTGDDYATIKYYPTGNTAWVRRYRGIAVTYPNGGDTLCVDSLVNITWYSFGVPGKVKIELSTNSGSTWDITLADSTPNDGDHPVYVPNTPSQHCRLKISALEGDPYGISDEDFIILREMILITSPVGGDIRCVDSTYNITWYARCLGDNVDIDYTSNGGASWLPVVGNTPNDGVHPWTTPYAPSEHCRVRVCDALDGDPCDTSNADFTITTGWLKLSSPNGEEIWCVDSSYNITWAGRCLTDNVNIEYSTNSGASWLPVVGNTPNDGIHPWTVPYTPSQHCRVRICDALDGVPCDTGNSDFTITTGWFRLTSPNGGENWRGGYQYYIRWSARCFPGNVRIDYSINSGVSFDSIICLSCLNTGEYLWTVPYISCKYESCNSCRVRICDAVDCIPADTSDSNFAIYYYPQTPVFNEVGLIALLILLMGTAVWMIKRKRLALERNS